MDDLLTFLAFPLNVFLAVLWATYWRWLWKTRPDGAVVRFLLSPAATVSSLVLLLAACLWIGFSGNRDFTGTSVFAAVLLYIQTVLFLVTLRGWRRPDGVIRWRFLLLHAGLLIAAAAGFWGAPDKAEYRVVLADGGVTETAFRPDGSSTALGYMLELKGHHAEMSAEGIPSHYEASVSFDGGEAVSVTVNHPYQVRFGEDIYLSEVKEEYCVLQIVRDPWRHVTLAGIVMLLAGAFLLFIKGPRK